MTDTLSYNNNIHDYDEQETAMKVFLAVYKNLCDHPNFFIFDPRISF